MTSGPGGRGAEDGGQATVEAALVLPLIATMLLAVVQIGLLVRAEVLVTHAAREAARAAAVDSDPEAAVTAARAASTLDPSRVSVELRGRAGSGSRVTAEVSYRAPTDVPLIGGLIGDVTLHATATMRVE